MTEPKGKAQDQGSNTGNLPESVWRLWEQSHPQAAAHLKSLKEEQQTLPLGSGLGADTPNGTISPDASGATPRGGPPHRDWVSEGSGPIAYGAHRSLIGRFCGPYRLEREIGRGGMGAVYLGSREDGLYHREVAVKLLLDANLDSQEMISRFLNEQQVMAALNHPNIAAIFDGGIQAEGIPYFLMELIDGTPLLEFVQEKRLGLRERLELFLQVTEAISFAHRHLIVHRDLKPDHLLVNTEGVVKILDFGIAKILDAPNQSILSPTTRTGQLVATPAYASPEMLEGKPVTVSADIYGLGVILFLLLTGEHPYALSGDSPVQTLFKILHDSPKNPSELLAQPRSHGSEHSLIKAQQVAGDLDLICLKAMAKQVDDRYVSVEAFQKDLERFLAGHPISIRPPSWSYRAKKAVKRHQTLFWSTLIALTALVAFSVNTALQNRKIAEKSLQIAAERDRGEEVIRLLEDLFLRVDPERFGSGELSALTLLNSGADAVQEGLQSSPEAKLHLLMLIARVYRDLNLFDRAEQMMNSAEAMANQHKLSTEVVRLDLGADRAGLAFRRGQAEEALCLIQTLEESSEAGSPINPAMATLKALCLQELREDEAAEFQFRQLLEETELSVESSHEERELMATLTNNLALFLHQNHQLDEAEVWYLQSLLLREGLYDNRHPRLAENFNNLGTFYGQRGDYEQSRWFLEKALTLLEGRYSPTHLSVVAVVNNLAGTTKKLGDWPESERLYQDALGRLSSVFEEDHPYVAGAANNLGLLWLSMAQLDKSRPLLQRSLEVYRRQYGSAHPHVGLVLINLGTLEEEAGRFETAEQLWLQAEALFRQEKEPQALLWHLAETCLTYTDHVLGRAASFDRRENRLREILKESPASLRGLRAKMLETLGKIALDQKNYLEAKKWLESSMALEHLPGSPWLPGHGKKLVLLIEAELGAGDQDSASAHLEALKQCWQGLPERFQKQHQAIASLENRLTLKGVR